MAKTIYCIMGRTASGKSFIAGKMSERFGLTQVKSYTTRAPRKSEIESGKSDHIFISKEEMEKMRDDMAAYTKIGEAEYCTTFSLLDKCDVYVIDPRGVKELKKKIKERGKDYRVVEIYISAPESLRKARYERRGGKDFEKREEAENEQFLAYEREGRPDIVVENDEDAEKALEKIEKEIGRGA